MYDQFQRYQSLPPPIQAGLQYVYQQRGGMGQGSPDKLIDILDTLTPWEMLSEQWIDKLPCYSMTGRTINLISFLKNSESVKVVLGLINGTDQYVVVKYVSSKKHPIDYEIGHYQRLAKMGCPLPWFSTEFYYWGTRVLVIEKLDPLGPYDDEYRVGRHVLRQLKYIHKYGCHSDIKPQNIMKRRNKDRGRYDYFLIDYGGLATSPLRDGYKRWLWTEKWTCQQPHAKNQVIKPYHDFIELAYVMKAIQNWRQQPPDRRGKYNDGNFRELKLSSRDKFKPLKAYLKLVNKGCIDHRQLIDSLS